VNNQPIQSEFSDQARQGQPFNIDFKRILYRAIQFWYLVVLSLMVALVIAFLNTRYATRIYPVSASILIKEKEETSEGKLLYNNPLVSGFRNYLNELYLIRSYPLIQRTLESLNFGVAFYNEGNVLTTELYKPQVKVIVIDNGGVKSSRFYFEILDSHQFQLTSESEQEQQSVTFNFNDTIEFKGLSLVFSITQDYFNYVKPNERLIFTYTDPELLTGAYVSRLRASWAEEGAGVINLSIDGSNPSKEIDFLTGLIAQYQRYDLEKKNGVASRTIDFISDQLVGISDSLRNVERQLERFKNNNIMTNLSEEAERLYTKAEGLESQRAELIIRKNYYKYLSEYLKQSKNLDQIILPTSVGISDPILTALVSSMVELQMQLKMNTKSENPIAAGTKRKLDEIRRDVVESVRNQESTDKIKQDYLDKQIRAIEKQLNFLPVAERQLVSIQRNYSLLENLYIFLLQKKAEAGISRASTSTDITIINYPMQAGEAISPKPSKNYTLAFVVGLSLPVLAFLLLEFFNNKVQSKEDVEKFTTIPFIGGVGHKSSSNNLEVLTHPKTSISESFRALRSNLNYFLGKQEKAVIMITSSISGEGKTFTSINLASVVTLSGKKTLIVGADMRRPKLFSDFNLTNDIGLSSYLANIAGFDEIVQKTSFPNLDLVSGGPVPPNPAELLLTPAMKNFVEEARKRYDYIIIDTPPMAIVTDAFVIADMVDHTLFLVRQNYTPKNLLKTTQDFYTSGKMKNISIVLNDIYRSGPGYGYGYNYGYGYGYGYGYTRRKNGYGYYSES
jgi:capsular exopolysaccharide synthesis family protein